MTTFTLAEDPLLTLGEYHLCDNPLWCWCMSICEGCGQVACKVGCEQHGGAHLCYVAPTHLWFTPTAAAVPLPQLDPYLAMQGPGPHTPPTPQPPRAPRVNAFEAVADLTEARRHFLFSRVVWVNMPGAAEVRDSHRNRILATTFLHAFDAGGAEVTGTRRAAVKGDFAELVAHAPRMYRAMTGVLLGCRWCNDFNPVDPYLTHPPDYYEDQCYEHAEIRGVLVSLVNPFADEHPELWDDTPDPDDEWHDEDEDEEET